ncbi:unnamed protein product [Toxocara canis]|uniref:C2 domain-containing protein n=1 Tax=Toxocara canis TaxID=6265 RepID=A0A183UI63_TOXCA|nr:unnamed protein product [Toxocara canis]
MLTSIPLDFNASVSSNSDGVVKRGSKRPEKRAFTHSGDTSSSEDDYQRNHDEGPRLSESGRAIKKRLFGENAARRNSPLKPQNKAGIRHESDSLQQRADLQEKAHKAGAALGSPSLHSVAVYDADFGIRIRNPKVSSTVFNTFCSGIEKIRPSRLKRGMPPSGQWITMGVVVDKSEYRKSTNGNEYMIWRLGDLTDCQQQPVKVLLFGECLKEHWKVQVGTAIALVSPAFMESDRQSGGDRNAICILHVSLILAAIYEQHLCSSVPSFRP